MRNQELFQCPAEFKSSLEGKSLEELESLQEELTRERYALKGKALAVAELRQRMLEEDNAANHGVTPEAYKQAKETIRERLGELETKAVEDGASPEEVENLVANARNKVFRQVLNTARKLQIARTREVSVKASSKKT